MISFKLYNEIRVSVMLVNSDVYRANISLNID